MGRIASYLAGREKAHRWDSLDCSMVWEVCIPSGGVDHGLVEPTETVLEKATCSLAIYVTLTAAE